MTDVETRQPTQEEAVDWIYRSITNEYRMLCIAHWRTLYGDSFADIVRRKAAEKLGKGKK